jgi:hypothetical protein
MTGLENPSTGTRPLSVLLLYWKLHNESVLRRLLESKLWGVL